jgi:LPXTG-motif cell wall-anchored protein
VGIAGHQSRRLQTGLSHHYFVIVGAGLVAIAGLLAVYR